MTIARTNLTQNYSVSRVLKGHWQLSEGHLLDGGTDEKQAVADMHEFVRAGVTTFDVADIYTGAEELIGQYRKAHPDMDVQIHTKYVPDMGELQTVSFDDAEAIIDRSLKRLNVDILDLVQYHWWDYNAPRYVEVAHYLKDLQTKGKIRHIGVTNFNTDVLEEIVESGLRVVSTQNQYSILDRRAEKSMVDLCAKHDMQLLCYGTLAGGFLSDKWLNVDEPDLSSLFNRSLIKYKLVIDDCGGWKKFQGLLQTLKSIGDKHNVGIGEVASAYILAQPYVAGVIIGAHNARHLNGVRMLGDLRLDADDIQIIGQYLDTLNTLDGDTFDLERNDIKHAGIMKTELNKA
jgi:aryl-alcohol dehydrogenase-like predicted oxidoreductase